MQDALPVFLGDSKAGVAVCCIFQSILIDVKLYVEKWF